MDCQVKVVMSLQEGFIIKASRNDDTAYYTKLVMIDQLLFDNSQFKDRNWHKII
jgi:hypothetical protein